MNLTPPSKSSREASPVPQLRPSARTASTSSLARTSVTTSPAPQPTPPSASQADLVQPVSPRPQRPLASQIPHWPTSPRLSLSRSPPPPRTTSPMTSPKRATDASFTSLPSVFVKDEDGKAPAEEPIEERPQHLHSGMRTPRHSASPIPMLETVTESSLPSTPAIGLSRTLTDKIDALARENEKKEEARLTTQESESESGNKSDDKPPSRAPSRQLARRPTVGNTSKGQGEPSRNMTAEIETVVSVPQQVNPTGSVKLSKKQSTDTIRPPKKEKKKSKRSLTMGTNRTFTLSKT